MMRIRRLPVTLLELLIAATILVAVSAVVIVSVNKAYVDQQFRAEAGRVVDKLRLAQDLMLLSKEDFRVKFTKAENGEGIEFSIQSFQPLREDYLKRAISAKSTLKAIKGVFFVDETLDEQPKEGEINARYRSNGVVMSKGIMRLASTDSKDPPASALQRYICFPGYPSVITVDETLEEAQKRCNAINDEFIEKVTSDTIARLPDSIKKKEEEAAEQQPEETNKPQQGGKKQTNKPKKNG
jgi:hypothetical protein